MHSHKTRSLIFILILTATVNLVQFGILPLFMRPVGEVSDISAPVPVAVCDFKEPTPEPERPREEPPEPELTPPVPDAPAAPRTPRMELPQMDFSVTPGITTSVQVPVPRNLVFELDDVDTAPSLAHRIQPLYPPRARQRGITGRVHVTFVVNPEGHTQDILIVNAKPKGVFDRSVIRAVSSWRFRPGLAGGSNVPVRMETDIVFSLDENM